MANFKINNVTIKNPTAFTIERFIITDLERLANAEMAGDFIAKKRKFFFTYDSLSSHDLDDILNEIWETTTLFHTLVYYENGALKTATVYVGSIPTDLHRATNGSAEWIWKDVKFNLIEK